ncbi:MAG TPA: DMT family transporter [Nannocystis sp.]
MGTGDQEAAEARALARRGVRDLLFAALVFSVMSVLAKRVGARVPVGELILVRSVMTLVLARRALRARALPVWGTRRRLLAARGALGFVALACYFYSITHLPIADAIVIHYTHPVFTMLLAALVLGEALQRREVVFIGGCFVGVVLVTRPALVFGATTASRDPFALAVAFAGALISAAVYVLIRELRATEHPLRVVFYNALVASALAAPWALAEWVAPDAGEWALLLAIGLCTYVYQDRMTRGLHHVRAGRATALGYVQVLASMLAGIWLFSEEVDAVGWLGAGVLALGAAALATEERGSAQRPSGSA